MERDEMIDFINQNAGQATLDRINDYENKDMGYEWAISYIDANMANGASMDVSLAWLEMELTD
jgi:hypothetical protein